MKSSYDVVVVGAGPSGSVAACRAAQAGLDVLLVEKRQEIGAPVRCAEAVGADNLRSFIDLNSKWIDAEICSFSLTNSQGVTVHLPPAEPTLVVNRKVMDLELARMAVNAGATVQTSMAATGLILEGRQVRGVRLASLGREFNVACSLVVAADGVESQVGRWAGLQTVPPLADYYVAVEYLVAGPPGWIDSTVCEYHLDHNLAPGGYLWVFPKGQTSANAGLVVPASLLPPGGAVGLLERFLAKRCPQASRLAVITGGIPVTGAIKKMTADGLVVVGDAAHQADPLTGGGINLGMIGAGLAMQVAVPAVRAGDTRAEKLAQYETLWQKKFGSMHASLFKIRKMFEKMNQERLDDLILTASKLPLDSMSLGSIVLNLVRKDPALLLEAHTLIMNGLITK